MRTIAAAQAGGGVYRVTGIYICTYLSLALAGRVVEGSDVVESWDREIVQGVFLMRDDNMYGDQFARRSTTCLKLHVWARYSGSICNSR